MASQPRRSAKEEREHLLRMIERPDDESTALAYAAWLDRWGDPAGELIRIRLDRARLCPDDPARVELERRERELLAEGKIKWQTRPGEDLLLPLIQRLGGTVWLDDSGRVHQIWLEGSLITRGCLERLADYPYLKGMRANKHIFTRDELDALSRLTSLESLMIEEAGLTDEAIAPLAELKALRQLDIGYNPIRGHGLVHLHGLKLEHLDLEGLDPPRDGRKDTPRPSDWMSALAGFPKLKWLDLHRNLLTGNGLVYLKNMVELETLEMEANSFEDDAFVHLAGLKSLRYLNLEGNPITAEGIKHLSGLTNLERLNLRFRDVGDAGVAHLSALKKLRELNLNNSTVPITDEGARHLRGLTALVELEIGSASLTDAALEHFAGMKELERLNLEYNPGIKGPGLVHLKALPNLKDLDLSGTEVSDTALPLLKTLTQLENLSHHMSRVTTRGRAALEKALPNAGVSGDYRRR